MKKMMKTAAAAAVLTAAVSMTAFAGEWKVDQTGWWYQNDDGGYLKDGWSWVDGRCYYFNAEGYCLTGTTTPDGYTVDDSGAWIVDGVVQTQGGDGLQSAEGTAVSGEAMNVRGQAGSQVEMNGLIFTIPDGFVKDETASNESGIYFTNGEGVIAIMSEDIPDADQYGSLLEVLGESILDIAMNQIGTPSAKEAKQLPTGIWYCYQYDMSQLMEVPGTMYAYARISNGKIQMVMMIGSMNNLSPDGVMMNYLR